MDLEKIKVLLTAILDTGKLLQETSRIGYDVAATDRILTSFNRASKKILSGFTELQDRLTAAESDKEQQALIASMYRDERDQLRAQVEAAKGQESLSFNDFINALKDAGWKDTADAQWDGASSLYQKWFAAPILPDQTTPAESVQIVSEEIKQVLIDAAQVVAWRNADISTEDGSYATTDADAIIRLERSLCDAFSTSSDDVILEEILPLIESMVALSKVEQVSGGESVSWLAKYKDGDDFYYCECVPNHRPALSYFVESFPVYREQPSPNKADVHELVNRVLSWPLPLSIVGRLGLNKVHNPIGTLLLNSDEAKNLIEYLLPPLKDE